MGFTRCAYLGCRNTSKTHSMFTFPVNDEERCQQWIKNSGSLDLISATTYELRCRHLCTEHFESRFMVCNGSMHKRTRLLGKAIPYPCPSNVETCYDLTLNVPSKIYRGKPVDKKKEMERISDVWIEARLFKDDVKLQFPSQGNTKKVLQGVAYELNELIHEDCICHACKGDIAGFRYTCLEGCGLDICSRCEFRGAHAEHHMLRVPPTKTTRKTEKLIEALRETLQQEIDSVTAMVKEAQNYVYPVDIKMDIDEETYTSNPIKPKRSSPAQDDSQPDPDHVLERPQTNIHLKPVPQSELFTPPDIKSRVPCAGVEPTIPPTAALEFVTVKIEPDVTDTGTEALLPYSGCSESSTCQAPCEDVKIEPDIENRTSCIETGNSQKSRVPCAGVEPTIPPTAALQLVTVKIEPDVTDTGTEALLPYSGCSESSTCQAPCEDVKVEPDIENRTSCIETGYSQNKFKKRRRQTRKV